MSAFGESLLSRQREVPVSSSFSLLNSDFCVGREDNPFDYPADACESPKDSQSDRFTFNHCFTVRHLQLGYTWLFRQWQEVEVMTIIHSVDGGGCAFARPPF
jgi:hypothetical protein